MTLHMETFIPSLALRRIIQSLAAALWLLQAHPTAAANAQLANPTVPNNFQRLASAPSESARQLPASHMLWPNDSLHFCSTDVHPIKITLKRNVPHTEGEEVHFEVPRAWVTRAEGYDPLRLDVLPDEVVTTEVELGLSSDGQPLSIRSLALSRDRAISWVEALQQLRPETFRVQLSYIPPSVTAEEYKNALHQPLKSQITKRDGLDYDSRHGWYVGDQREDLFYRISCQFDAREYYFCDYRTRISDSLISTVTFTDFRFHGGREYANKRIRLLLGIMCRQLGSPACGRGD